MRTAFKTGALFVLLIAGTAKGAVLDSGMLRVEFADAAYGFAPTGIVNRLTGEVRFLSGAPMKKSLCN